MFNLSKISDVLSNVKTTVTSNNLNNLLDENFRPSINVTMENIAASDENMAASDEYNVKIDFKTKIIGEKSKSSENISIISNFSEVPVIGLLAQDITDCIAKGFFEIVLDKTYIDEIELTKFNKEYLKHISNNSKDFFYILHNKEAKQIQLLRIFTLYISSSIGLYTESKAVRNARKSKKDK